MGFPPRVNSDVGVPGGTRRGRARLPPPDDARARVAPHGFDGRIDRGAAPASVPAGVHDARQLRVRAAIEGATSHPVNFRRRAAQRVFTMVLRAETLIALW